MTDLKLVDDFPGNSNAPGFLEKIIAKNNVKTVADIGGGAKPLLPKYLVDKYGLNYYVLDISKTELSKAPAWCNGLEADIESPDFHADMSGKFDLVFSHMLLEHIRNPIQTHQNINALLRKDGLAVHFYPSPHNLPLFLNRLLPESLSQRLVNFFQPTRDKVYDVKFPAYYKLCGASGNRLRSILEPLGYSVEEHVGYIGHSYYARFFITRKVEEWGRHVFLGLHLPITSTVHIVLRKR
jgi:SAM-dependent methyltransferase